MVSSLAIRKTSMLTGIRSSVMPLTNVRSQLTRRTATEWVIDWRQFNKRKIVRGYRDYRTARRSHDFRDRGQVMRRSLKFAPPRAHAPAIKYAVASRGANAPRRGQSHQITQLC